MTTRAQQCEYLLAGVQNGGSPVTNGYAKFFVPGTTTLKTAWSDRDKSTPVTKVALDVNGRAEVWMDGIYLIKIYSGDPDAAPPATGVEISALQVDAIKAVAVDGNVRTLSTDTTGSVDDGLVLLDTAGGNVEYELPDATLIPGRTIPVQKIASANTATIAAASGQTINGAASLSITSQYDAAICISNGTSWAAARQTLGSLGVSAFVQTLVDDADAAAFMDTLGISTFAQTVLDDTSAGAARVTLGVITPPEPGHRLTVTTASPVPDNAVNQGTMYFTPHKHNVIVLDNGGVLTPYNGAEVSQTLADNTKSPAAGAANSNYDMFAWIDSGTFRCTRGPAWTSVTVRGTGAGTTELERNTSGQWVNKYAITNGPAAGKGLYVGTINTHTGAAQVNQTRGGALTAGYWGVWNMFNRVAIDCQVTETTDTWTYSTATIRQARGSAANQVSFVRGLNEDGVIGFSFAVAQGDVQGQNTASGIGLDATNAFTGLSSLASVPFTNGRTLLPGRYEGQPGLGKHYLAWLEYGHGSGTQTWYGDGGSGVVNTGLQVHLLA